MAAMNQLKCYDITQAPTNVAAGNHFSTGMTYTGMTRPPAISDYNWIYNLSRNQIEYNLLKAGYSIGKKDKWLVVNLWGGTDVEGPETSFNSYFERSNSLCLYTTTKSFFVSTVPGAARVSNRQIFGADDAGMSHPVKHTDITWLTL